MSTSVCLLLSNRSDKARSFRDEDSEGDENPESFYPPPAPPSTRSPCKKCKVSIAEHTIGDLGCALIKACVDEGVW